MKPIILFVIFLFAGLISHAQYNEKNLSLEATSTVTRYQYQNLRLYPIRANAVFASHHKGVGRYTTLQHALEKKKVAITEVGSGREDGTVNTLFIENVSRDTIMVLAGEVVKGGKQDRVIAQDFLLYPGSGKKDVSVFCVEHGRWQSGTDGKSFNQYLSVSPKEVRKAAVVKKDQREVWDKVSEVTQKNSAESSTGTLAALKLSAPYKTDIKKYTDHFKGLLINESNVIGVVAVSGNTVLGCDMFATHELFRSHYVNLVNSYAAEAISSGKPVTISHDEVKQYLQKLLADESKQEGEIKRNGIMLKDGKQKLHISTF